MQQRNHIFRTLAVFFALSLCVAANVFAESEDNEGETLPLPRFVSLKSSEINVRTGPGTRYPISWIYKREGLPVEITEESDHWRKIRDFEGSEGWILRSMLSGKRSAIIQGKMQVLYKSDDETSAPLLRAEPMVIGRLLSCTREWCKLQIDGRKGWMPKTAFWGAYPNEEFGN